MGFVCIMGVQEHFVLYTCTMSWHEGGHKNTSCTNSIVIIISLNDHERLFCAYSFLPREQ